MLCLATTAGCAMGSLAERGPVHGLAAGARYGEPGFFLSPYFSSL